jgi:hypothetical protein
MRKWMFFLIFCSSAFAGQRLYIGTDFYYQDFKERFITKVSGKEKSFFRTYKIGYDLEKPNFIYIGGDFQQNKAKINEKVHKKHEHVHSDYMNTEGRLGYNILPYNRIFLIPFIGAGDHHWIRKKNPYDFDKIKYHWAYVAYGIRVNCIATEYLQIGFRAKLEQLVKGSVKLFQNHHTIYQDLYLGSDQYKFDLKKKLCYELELPILLTPQTFQPFDLALIPYFQKYILNDSVSSIYLENTLFSSSKGKSYDTGLRIEIGFNF